MPRVEWTKLRGWRVGSTTFTAIALAVTVLVFICLGAMFAKVIYPIDDEAFFASPAANLVTRGFFGTTTYENPDYRNLDCRTYWIMPLYPLALSGWFSPFGVGLIQQRSMSVFFGVIAMLAWFVVVGRLSGDRRAAILAAALVAIDNAVLAAAGNGRMDMMGAALGACSLAAFLALRDRNPRLGVLLGYAAVVLAGMTHPAAGILSMVNLTAVLILNRGVLDRKALLLIPVPFIAGALAWSAYVLPHFADFLTQFVRNISDGSAQGNARLGAWADPTRILTVAKYILSTNFLPVEGSGGIAWVKLLIPISYALAVGLALFVRSIRRAAGVKTVLLVTALTCICLPLLESRQKWQYYIHILILFAPLLAVIWSAAARASRRWAIAASAIVAVVASVQLLRDAHSIRRNEYGRRYAPVAGRLKKPPFDRGRFVGGAEWAYATGLDRLTEENSYGCDSGKRADFLILSESILAGLPERCRTALKAEYQPAFSSADALILQRVYVRVPKRAKYRGSSTSQAPGTR